MSERIYKIAAMAGDGIGPEVVREALKVLRAAEGKFGFQLDVTEAPVGWAGIDAAGKALPDDTLALCRESDSILFGSVGLPDRDPSIPKEERPERAALPAQAAVCDPADHLPAPQREIFTNYDQLRLPFQLWETCRSLAT